MGRVKETLKGYTKYRSKGHYIFLLHRISGLTTIIFLTLHITTTSMVFFAPGLYEKLIKIFRNPIVMLAEIIMAFFVVYHGVNGLRIAYFDLFRPDLWEREPTSMWMSGVFITAIVLWLPAVGIMGFDLLKYGFGLFGGK